MVAFAAGWPTSEAPLVSIAAQASATMLAVRAGAVTTTVGRLGLTLGATSWMAMAGLGVSADRASSVLDDALVAALGASYRAEIPEMVRSEAPLTVTERSLPRIGDRRRFRATRNVAYADDSRRNRLDIWRRADLPTNASAPVLVHVHGGAWMIGQKEIQGEVLLTEMARRGWVGVSIGYRLSPTATWPEHIIDVKRAIAWTRASVAQHGGDPSFIAVTGGSAGGHLAALAALTADSGVLQPGFEEADTSVQACVPMYGVYDVADLAESGRTEIADVWERYVMKTPRTSDRAAWEAASPIARVHRDAPPLLVIHGANDTLVPVDQARRFVERMRAASTQPVAYAELPGAQHAFDVFRSVRGIHTVRAVARFLDVVHTRASR